MTEDKRNEFDKHVKSVDAFINAGDFVMANKMLEVLGMAFPGAAAELTSKKAEIFRISGAKDKADEIYASNLNLIRNYKMVFGQLPQQPEWYVIDECGDSLLCYDYASSKEMTFSINYRSPDPDETAGRAIITEGMVKPVQFIELATITEDTVIGNGYKVPIYAAFDNIEIQLLLQESGISEMIDMNRFIFIMGEDGIRNCLYDSCMQMPSIIVNCYNEKPHYQELIASISSERAARSNDRLNSINAYYENNKNEIDERVKSGKPRILFWTSRFTATVKNHTRDSMQAALKQGCECYMLIEPDDLMRVTYDRAVDAFYEFLPDVVFDIDHFRFEGFFDIPKEIIYICWIQDPMPVIMDPCSKDKLLARDVLFNHIIGDDNLKNLYPNMLIDAPIPANADIYKPYVLTDIEREKYEADICFVCHASNVDEYIDRILESYRDSDSGNIIHDIVQKIIYDYVDQTKRGEFLYKKEDFSQYILQGFRKNGYVLENGAEGSLADEMYKWLNQRLFRQTIVDWIIDAGFENIKLWGNGWINNKKYEKYAMGPAENGEVLSKIYQSSKIVVGNNIMTTAAARAWESMLSGAFYLSNYIPQDADWCDIRKIVPEGYVEFFKDRDELIRKLHFYLDNEEARKEKAAIGRSAALETMTFDVFVKKMLSLLPNYLD